MLNNETLETLYTRHSHELIVFIFSFLKSQEAAEDVLHDVFIRLLNYSRKYPLDLEHIRAFLYKTARNLCIDNLRSGKRMEPAPLDETHASEGASTPQDELEREDLARSIRTVVDRKDPLTRSVFSMRTELGLTYAEIATNLEISERTAKRRMSSLIDELARELEKSGFGNKNRIFMTLFLMQLV